MAEQIIPQEIIVVEGRDDTARLDQAFGQPIDTIETNGSQLSDATLALIKTVAEKRGVIVFTDPDLQGERLRKLITEAIPDAKHAFLTKAAGKPKRRHGSLGIEHATDADIIAALQNVMAPSEGLVSDITQEDLIYAGVLGGAGAKERRQYLGEILHVGYANGKQFSKRLAMFGIRRTEFLEAVVKLNGRSS